MYVERFWSIVLGGFSSLLLNRSFLPRQGENSVSTTSHAFTVISFIAPSYPFSVPFFQYQIYMYITLEPKKQKKKRLGELLYFYVLFLWQKLIHKDELLVSYILFGARVVIVERERGKKNVELQTWFRFCYVLFLCLLSISLSFQFHI